MIPAGWRDGEVAVVGLGRSGVAAARFLAEQGLAVYASDSAANASVHAAKMHLTASGIDVEVGRHDLERIGSCAAVVVSPGVPLGASPLRAARAAGKEIVAELDLAAMVMPDARLIVVTGTNGKTTTTALIAHILRESGRAVVAAGNIGVPLIEVASAPESPDWIAVEASSFQLHDAPHLSPTIGVLTNLAPDHLDRYDDVQAYYADKRNLFRNARPASVWVLNRDDPAVLELAAGAVGSRKHWSMLEHADGWYDRSGGQMMLEGSRPIPRTALALLGDHNVSNALAAALTATATGVEADAIARALRSFQPLPHRLEPVREVADVLWINDSKATNLSSASVAVAAMERPFVLILGGRPKGESFSPLTGLLGRTCRGVVAYGEAAELIRTSLGSSIAARIVGPFEDAVSHARDVAVAGDAVLLSPGCASFDQFTDYERRGDRFRDLVEDM